MRNKKYSWLATVTQIGEVILLIESPLPGCSSRLELRPLFGDLENKTVYLYQLPRQMFFSLSEACQQIMWIRFILRDLGKTAHSPTTVFEDNAGALHWGTEGVRNAKYVSIRRKFVKEKVKNGVVNL